LKSDIRKSKLGRIGDVPMECPLCGWKGRLDDTEPAVDDEGQFGCPVTECGGIVKEKA